MIPQLHSNSSTQLVKERGCIYQLLDCFYDRHIFGHASKMRDPQHCIYIYTYIVIFKNTFRVISGSLLFATSHFLSLANPLKPTSTLYSGTWAILITPYISPLEFLWGEAIDLLGDTPDPPAEKLPLKRARSKTPAIALGMDQDWVGERTYIYICVCVCVEYYRYLYNLVDMWYSDIYIYMCVSVVNPKTAVHHLSFNCFPI